MRLLLVGLLLLLSTAVRAQTQILAQVNDDIVSKRDFDRRLALLKITDNVDTGSRDVQKQLLNQLIDEKLKRQEAARAGVSVSGAEVKQAVKEAMRQNGLDFDTVQKKMAVNGLSSDVLEQQVESDLLFVRAIRKTAGRQRRQFFKSARH